MPRGKCNIVFVTSKLDQEWACLCRNQSHEEPINPRWHGLGACLVQASAPCVVQLMEQLKVPCNSLLAPLSPSRPGTGSRGIISADREPCGRQKPTSRTRTLQGVKLRVEDSSSRRSGSGEQGGSVGAEAAGPGVGPAGLTGRTDSPPSQQPGSARGGAEGRGARGMGGLQNSGLP